MSTYINVTVDGGGLSDKAKAQTNANRQAKLESDNRQKVETKGREQRDATRAQDGIGPNGQPLYGTPARSTLRRDEPAAFRNSDEYFLLKPTAGPVSGLIQLQHKGFISSLTVSGGVPTYSPIVGPNGIGVLLADNSPRGNYVHLTGTYPPEGSISKWKQGVKDFTLQFGFRFGETYVDRQDAVDVSVRVGNNGFVDIAVGLEYIFGNTRKTLDCTVYPSLAGPPVNLVRINEPLQATGELNLRPGVWHHVAISKSSGNIRAFFDGVQIGMAEVTWELMEFLAGADDTWANIYFGASNVNTVPAQPVYLHNLRFDAKALFQTDFTPPYI
jgi:hypothetical protein